MYSQIENPNYYKKIPQLCAILVFTLIISCKEKGSREDGYYDYSADKVVTFKKVDGAKLKMKIFYPPKNVRKKSHPTMVFYFGGGWINGDSSQFAPQAEYYAEKGFVCILIDYRIKSKHNSTPFDALEDAKSSMRYLKKNAKRYRIDSTKIIAVGASSGGHLATAMTFIDDFNATEDDLSISTAPDALILFNPTIDNGPEGYGYDIVKERYREFSPLHNIKRPAPPTLILIGSKDQLISMASISSYKSKMDSLGSKCILKIYEGEKHGFFNYRYEENYNKTLKDVDAFLIELGY